MGIMVMPVCHTCRDKLDIGGWKALEVRLNPDVAAKVGAFWALHPGCRVELLPDIRWDEADGYDEEPQS
jgi:hypothetical protein